MGKPSTFRRLAAVLALFGVMLVSSGLALIATATPAQATAQIQLGIKVCHANSSGGDADPYDYEITDVGGAIVHTVFHRLGGLSVRTWANAGTWNGVWHDAGDPRPDFVVPLDPDFSESWCEAPAHPPVTADVTWTEPSCENGNVASYSTEGEHVTFAIDSGAAAPGASIVVKATADAGYRFAGNQASQSFEHTFAEAEDCTAYDATADIAWVEPNCENGNTASWNPVDAAFVTYEVTSGTVAPGETVEITATADEGHAFADESTTKVFEHTFAEAEDCEVVEPPVEVTPGAPTFTDPTCSIDPSMSLPEPTALQEQELLRSADLIDAQDIDGVHYVVTGEIEPGGTVDVDATPLPGFILAEGATTHWTHTFANPDCSEVSPTEGETVVQPAVVHAGLVDATAAAVDPRSQQGLALSVAGLVVLLIAGALGLTPTVSRRR